MGSFSIRVTVFWLVFWSSSNEDVASVNQTGVVTAHSKGEVRILAISMDNPRKFDTVEIQIVQQSL